MGRGPKDSPLGHSRVNYFSSFREDRECYAVLASVTAKCFMSHFLFLPFHVYVVVNLSISP